MKISTKILVFLGLLLLVFLTGSEVIGQVVDRSRYYCPVHDKIYAVAGEHGSQCSRVRTAPPAENENLYCQICNTRYPKGTIHTCPKLLVVLSKPSTQDFAGSVGSETRKYRTTNRRESFIDILVVQQPQRYIIYRDYGGRNYYNLRGWNVFRELFGDKHHHRDHHEPERHKHSDHHRGLGSGYHGHTGYRGHTQ